MKRDPSTGKQSTHERNGDASSSAADTAHDLFSDRSFLERAQEAGRIGCFILEIPSTNLNEHKWHSTRMMNEIFGIDTHYPRTGESWLALIVQRVDVEKYFYTHVMQGKEPFEMTYQIRRPSDGKLRWIFGKGDVECDGSGRPARLIGTVQDITEQKDSQDRIRLFQFAVDRSFDAVFWLDRDAHFTYANDKACSSLGYTRDELLKLSVWDIDPVYKKETWHESWEQFSKGPISSGEIIESVHRRKDSTTFPVEIVSSHLRIDDIELHIAVVRDISERKRTEQKLLDSEHRIRNILQAMPSGIHRYHLADNGKLIFDGANSSADRILGIDHTRFIGQSIEEAFPALAGTEVPEMYRKAAAEGVGWTNEQITYHDGSISGAFDVTAFQIEPGHMAAVFTDITERKKNEEAIRFQNLILKTQQETAPGGILVVNESGKILFSNRKFAEMWQIPEEVVASGEDETVLTYAKEKVANPQPFMEKTRYLYSHHDVSDTSEFQLKNGDFFERYSTPMIGENNQYYGRVWYFRNVTERKKAESEIRKNEEEFRSLFEATPFGAAMLIDRKYKRVSNRFTAITGYTAEELYNKPTRLLYPDDETNDEVGRELYASLARDGFGSCETQLKRKDGTILDVQINARYLDPEDPSKGVTATIEDISLRKKAEADRGKLQEELVQAQKMESIGRLAGGIAHDFNNLLTAIMGNTELALHHISKDDGMYSQLSTVMKAAESAADLTRQLLAFSRKQIIDPKVVSINDLIDTIHEMLVRVIGENITLRAVPQPGLHAVKVDITQIQQIIMNLSINARDAMPDGGTLSIETANVILDDAYCRSHSYPIRGEHVMLAVSDTGTGMSEETQSHLFEPFFTTKAAGKGTGLGLATVYGAVLQNGGTIDVYSEEGKGTCFKVYFPAVDTSAAGVAADRKTDTLPEGNETILLVEDNPMVLQFSESTLRLLGYTVLTATSGEEALEISSGTRQKIHMLMTDVILSGINGKTLAEKISALRPDMKVLFNSGYTEKAIVAHGVLSKGLNFIGKPFSASDLAHKIREVLDTKQSSNETKK